MISFALIEHPAPSIMIISITLVSESVKEWLPKKSVPKFMRPMDAKGAGRIRLMTTDTSTKTVR